MLDWRILDWKKKLNKRSNTELLDLFRESNRINIDPQIYAGNLLFERGYNSAELLRIKNDLKNAIEVAFEKMHGKSHSEIVRENVIRELFYCTMLAVLLTFGYSKQGFIKFDDLFESNIPVYVVLICISFLRMLFIKRSNQKAIQKYQKSLQEKQELVAKINRELKF
ncbi:hypothetical protein [Marinifilum flexuosum]|uniref:Uncharacterized protein n=1 Tax=Marinifilum flexuosum TaxID=1117708 RepID=A0A419X7F7_9BACT|nr:hypothetical protein [Marinifilum flexuosum]RKE03671.1 hypothetical protein BXY64_0680 [Marinifilum flexuosum]